MFSMTIHHDWPLLRREIITLETKDFPYFAEIHDDPSQDAESSLSAFRRTKTLHSWRPMASGSQLGKGSGRKDRHLVHPCRHCFSASKGHHLWVSLDLSHDHTWTTYVAPSQPIGQVCPDRIRQYCSTFRPCTGIWRVVKTVRSSSSVALRLTFDLEAITVAMFTSGIFS